MVLKDVFKREDSLTKELKMLPRETRKRILENVSRRRNEILEEKLLEKQLKQYKDDSRPEKRRWSSMKEGMAKRREELRKEGILKPIVRYDKKNFKSSLQEMSEKSRQDEIKRIESQRARLKSGHSLGGNGISESGKKIKLKDLKLKAPQTTGFEGLKRKKKQNGLIDSIKKRSQKVKDMNWSQAKKAYPQMKPLGDSDNDSVRNMFDCKPFDKKRQGRGKYYMIYDEEREYGLVHGREEERRAKKSLKKRGKKGVSSFEYDYEE